MYGSDHNKDLQVCASLNVLHNEILIAAGLVLAEGLGTGP